jgi:hypothetical protein
MVHGAMADSCVEFASVVLHLQSTHSDSTGCPDGPAVEASAQHFGQRVGKIGAP